MRIAKEAEVLGDNIPPVPLRPPQIPHDLSYELLRMVIGCGSPEGFGASKFTRFLASHLTDRGKIFSLTFRTSFIPRKIPGTNFLLEVEYPTPIMQLERFVQLENPLISKGIKRAIFRLVAKCLKQLPYRWPYNGLLRYTSLLCLKANIATFRPQMLVLCCHLEEKC
jgi:hypothetical protein